MNSSPRDELTVTDMMPDGQWRSVRESARVVYCAQGGLANRMRALAGYQQLAEVLGQQFVLCWQPDWACPARFAELFANPGLTEVDGDEAREMEQQGSTVLLQESIWPDMIWERYLRDVMARETFCRQAVRQLEELKPVEAIRNSVDAFASVHRLNERVGVHVRWTDNLTAVEWWEKYSRDEFRRELCSSIEGFERAVDRALGEWGTVFLATDNKDIERRFRRRRGSRIATYPKRFHAPWRIGFSWRRLKWYKRRGRTSSVQHALTELLLLSRCRSIIGTYKSSFSTVAALLGGVPHYQVRGEHCVESGFMERFAVSEASGSATTATEAFHTEPGKERAGRSE